MKNQTSTREFAITTVIKVSGYSAIFFVGIIFYFLLSRGLPALKLVDLRTLFSTRWYPSWIYDSQTGEKRQEILLVDVDSIVRNCLVIPHDSKEQSYIEIWDRELWGKAFHKC